MRNNINTKSDADVVSSPEGAILQTQELSTGEVKKRSLKGVLSFVFRTLSLTGIAILAQGILSAALKVEEYGVYALVVTIGNFFTIISDVGLGATLIQKKQEPTIEELRTVFTVQQVLAWIVCGFIILTCYVLNEFGRMSIEGVYLAIAFGLTFPIVSFKTISSIILERKLRFDKLVIVAIVESIIFNAIVIPLALSGYGVNSFTPAVIAKAVSGVICMYFLQRWNIGVSFSWVKFRSLMRTGGAFQLNDMLAKAKDDLFYISLLFFVSPLQYGYISWAKTWSRFPYTLTVDNVTAITFPAYSRLQHDLILLRKAVEKTLFLITLLAFPLLGGFSIMLIPFIHVFPTYLKWEPAMVSLLLFSFSLSFSAFSTPLMSTLQAIGQINESLKMMIFWTIMQWVLFFLLFQYLGFQTVAIISAILAVTSLFVVKLTKKHIQFSFVDAVWRQAVAATLMVVVLYYFRDFFSQTIIHFSAGIITGATVFTILMCLFGFEKMRVEITSLVHRSKV